MNMFSNYTNGTNILVDLVPEFVLLVFRFGVELNV